MNQTPVAKLGSEVRDKITGLTGILVSIHHFIGGSVRVNLQPSELKDGLPQKVVAFDYQQLEWVGEGREADIIQPKNLMPLGTKVKSKVNGFTGIVTADGIWLYGCARFDVTPDKLNKDGKPHYAESFDYDELEVIKAVEQPRPVETAKRPGGPDRNMPGQREIASR